MNENAFNLLNSQIIEKLKKIGIETPTKVQNQVIPKILEGKDVIFQSETGTGKTFAFSLPIVHKILENQNPQNLNVETIIVSPTFELASQTKQALQSICDFKIGLFLGQTPIKRQIEALKEKPKIVVGTPYRLVELIQLKKLKIQNVKNIIFDEADRFVKKESIEDVKNLISLLPENIQQISCSATISNNTRKFFKGEEIILPPEDILKTHIEHWAIFAEKRDKIDTLKSFILAANPEKILIFTSKPSDVENIYSKLKYKKINCSILHSKADKQERKAVIDRFKSGKERILITSDLSSRGLDIKNISHVVQMDLPDNEDFFIHRAGRTARAGKSGINVVIGDEFEMRNYSKIEKKLGIKVYPKEIYSGKIIEPRL